MKIFKFIAILIISSCNQNKSETDKKLEILSKENFRKILIWDIKQLENVLGSKKILEYNINIVDSFEIPFYLGDTNNLSLPFSYKKINEVELLNAKILYANNFYFFYFINDLGDSTKFYFSAFKAKSSNEIQQFYKIYKKQILISERDKFGNTFFENSNVLYLICHDINEHNDRKYPAIKNKISNIFISKGAKEISNFDDYEN